MELEDVIDVMKKHKVMKTHKKMLEENNQKGSYVPLRLGNSCPNCGYCPHCGRGGHYTRPYDAWPYEPPYTVTWTS